MKEDILTLIASRVSVEMFKELAPQLRDSVVETEWLLASRHSCSASAAQSAPSCCLEN